MPARLTNLKATEVLKELCPDFIPLTDYPGTYSNWSIDGWHIDHILPVSKFDLTDREQFLKVCHYTNLQPLWAKENLAKSNKIL